MCCTVHVTLVGGGPSRCAGRTGLPTAGAVTSVATVAGGFQTGGSIGFVRGPVTCCVQPKVSSPSAWRVGVTPCAAASAATSVICTLSRLMAPSGHTSLGFFCVAQ